MSCMSSPCSRLDTDRDMNSNRSRVPFLNILYLVLLNDYEKAFFDFIEFKSPKMFKCT